MNKLSPFIKLKTSVKQKHYIVITSVLIMIIISGAVLIYLNLGFKTDSYAAIGSNMGFENNLTEWQKIAGTWNISTTDKRSGTSSGLCSANTTEAKLRNNSSMIVIPASGTNYITVIAYAKASNTTGRARVGIYNTTTSSEVLAGTFTSLTSGGYTQLIYHAIATNNQTYIPVLSAKTTSGSANISFDDVIIYTSTYTSADITEPGQGKSINVSVNATQINLNWINGNDAQSGLGGVLILRTPGISNTTPSCTNQVTYHPSNTTIGPTSISGFNVIYNSAVTNSVNNNPGSYGTYTYLIYARDKAYNYATNPIRVFVLNGTNISQPLSTDVSLHGLYIAPTCTLSINSSSTLTFEDYTPATIYGYLKSTGRIVSNNYVAVSMKDGSVYEYNRNKPQFETTPILQATWESGSTCLITGPEDYAPSGFNQTFHHFTWNCNGQNFKFQLPANLMVNGNLLVQNTNSNFLGSKSFCFNGECIIRGNLSINNSKAKVECNSGSKITMRGDVAQDISGSFYFENLEVDNTNGINTDADQIVDEGLYLTNGDFNLNNKTIQMVNNSLISRDGGSVSGGTVDMFLPWVPTNTYNLRYTASCTTGIELMPSSTKLKDLTINVGGLSSVTLNKHAVVNGTLKLNDGKISTGAYEVRVTSTSATAISFAQNSFIEGNLRRNIINTGSTIYNFPVGNADKQQLAIITANALKTTSSLLAAFSPNVTGNAPNPTTCKVGASGISTILNLGIWNIEPNIQPTGGNYDITLKAQGFTNPIANVLGYCVIKRKDANNSWQSVGIHSNTTQSLNNGILSVKRSSLSSFSDFAIAYGSGFSLPISLSSFDVAQLESDQIKIYWTTAAELNNAYFSLERSSNGIDFEMINEQEGAGTSTTVNHYQYIDLHPLKGINYYRLKQVDFDGQFTYGPIKQIALSNSLSNSNPLLNITVYPNPTSGIVHVSNIPLTMLTVTVKVFDVSGQLVKQLSFSDGNNIQFNLSDQTPGIYMLNISDQENHSFNKQLILQL